MPSEKAVCPESTIESANRRNFVKRAALATAAIGVGSALLAKNTLPGSSASSNAKLFGCCSAACGIAVEGLTTGIKGTGVFGNASGPVTLGVPSDTGIGVKGSSAAGIGVYGCSPCFGVQGVSFYCCVHDIGGDKSGVQGCSISGPGVAGSSISGYGVAGSACGVSGVGVLGSSGYTREFYEHTPAKCLPSSGVFGLANLGTGVYGKSCSGYGVQGHSTKSAGVYGTSCCSYGVRGCSGKSYGVYGQSACSYGVEGYSPKSVGVYGKSCCSIGVQGHSPKSYGVYGTSSSSAGVSGVSCCGNGVEGCSVNRVGVYGNSRCGIGVEAHSTCSCGVYGASCCGYGVSGHSSALAGVYGSSPNAPGVVGIGCKVGINAVAGKPNAIPMIVSPAQCQTANLQEWNSSRCTPLSVVNKCGWLGVGTSSPTTPLQVNGGLSAKTTIVTSSYTMSALDFGVLVNASSAALKVTLPPASTALGMLVLVKKIDSSSNAVTIAASGTNKVDGKASQSLAKQYDSYEFVSDGSSNWYIAASATK